MVRKVLSLTILFALLATMLLACGAEETTTVPEATSVPATAEPEESSITVVIAEEPPGFNSISQTGYDFLVMEMVLLGVAEIDPYGNVFPELAVELPTVSNGGVEINEDLWTMTVTWRLRDDIYWADGEPVTADDVVFTWNAIADPETGTWVPGLDYTGYVEKVDDYTFVVSYTTIYPGYLTQFGGEDVAIWPEHYCDAGQGYAAWDCAQNPLSDGPYVLEEWVRGDHMSFVRNPTYYEQGKPYIDRVIVQVVPDAAVRKTMMVEGEGDLNMWISEIDVKDYEDAPGVDVTISPTGRWAMRLFFNLVQRGTTDPEGPPHPILADLQVRKAIRAAIDVDTLANDIFAGYSNPVWTEFFRPPYVCDVPRPEYNPEAAKAMLEEAGWTDTDNDGIRECHGCANAEEGYRMSLELATYAEYGEALELAQQLVGEMLREIGIEANLVVIQGSIMWADSESGGTEQNGNFDIDMWDDGYAGIDPSDHLWYYYYSDAAIPDYGFNIGRWINEDADYYIDESYVLDEEYRQEVFCELAQLLDEQVPQVLLFTTIDADAVSDRLEGVQATVNDIVTWNIADWKIK